jgi:hypothetical protein
MKRNEVTTSYEIMGRARRWSHMLRDFCSMSVVMLVALGVAWLGDPLRDEDTCADTESNRKQKRLVKTQK